MAARRVCAAVLAGVVTAAVAQAQPIPPPAKGQGVGPNGDYAYHANYHYDPSKCSRDAAGMVYFAVGRRVLRQPLDNLVAMMGVSVSERRAMPQTRFPDEPWGCPDHPLQNATYTLNHVSAMPDAPTSPVAAQADAITVIIHDGEFPFRQDFLVHSKQCEERMTDKSVPGFIGCRIGPCEGARTYEATEYAEPNGIKVTIDCDAFTGCDFNRARCQGGYLLKERFTVNFIFRAGALPLPLFTVADTELRHRLIAAEVVDFEWAE